MAKQPPTWNLSDQDSRRTYLASVELGHPGEGLVRKQHRMEVKAIDTDAKTVEFVISTEDVDRDGDVIRVAGWELEAFKANPVVLWAHSHSIPPIARAPQIHVKGTQLRSGPTEFYDSAGPHGEFAQELFDMYALGFLRATSVGFRPTKVPELRRGDPNPETGVRPVLGLEFTAQELMEFSAVPVPSNPNALATFAAKGVVGTLFPTAWPHIAPVLGYNLPDAVPEPTPDAAERAREIRADHLKRVGLTLDLARIDSHLQQLIRRL